MSQKHIAPEQRLSASGPHPHAPPDHRLIEQRPLRQLITAGHLMSTMLEVVVDDPDIIRRNPEMIRGLVASWQKQLQKYRAP
jgi:hypothetical protein